MLVTIEQSFEQKTKQDHFIPLQNFFLEFEVFGDCNNFIDPQKIYLEINWRIHQKQ